MTRKLMVMTYDALTGRDLTGRDDRDPTPADIAQWLADHPAEAFEIVGALKVAGPWVCADEALHEMGGEQSWCRPVLGGGAWTSAAANVECSCLPDEWEWWIQGPMTPVGTVPFDSLHDGTPDAAKAACELAKAAADAALREAGWSLA